MVNESIEEGNVDMETFIPQMKPLFGEEEALALYEYVKSGGHLTEYEKTWELERVLADFTGASYCLLVNNGTMALSLALLAMGIGPGDEVIVPNLTMIATPNSVQWIGARPVLTDVESSYLGLSLENIQKALTKKTKAVIYVSFNGRAAPMAPLVKFCREKNLALIEDAAQSLGSKQEGKQLGTFGDIGVFSLSSPKIISTGQGGVLVTNRSDLFQKLRALKDFGREKGGVDVHPVIGFNSKFTDLQAVVGLEQMKKLPARIQRKKEIYRRFTEALKNFSPIEILPTDLRETTPWFVDIYLENPSLLQDYLKKNGVGSRALYPPIHRQPAYQQQKISAKENFPVTESYSRRGLWLPSSSQLTDMEIEGITKKIFPFFGERKGIGKGPSVSIIIPTRNERHTIGTCLKEIESLKVDFIKEIIVVDGSSRDGTAEVVKHLGYRVIPQEGKGLGMAFNTGIKAATGDALLFFDADCSFNPQAIRPLWECLKRGKDAAFCSRYLPGAGSDDDTWIRALGNWIFTWSLRKIRGMNLSDSLFCYTMIRKEAFDTIRMTSTSFEWCMELPIRVHQQKLSYEEIPSRERPRLAGKSKVNAFYHGFRILWTLLTA